MFRVVFFQVRWIRGNIHHMFQYGIHLDLKVQFFLIVTVAFESNWHNPNRVPTGGKE